MLVELLAHLAEELVVLVAHRAHRKVRLGENGGRRLPLHVPVETVRVVRRVAVPRARADDDDPPLRLKVERLEVGHGDDARRVPLGHRLLAELLGHLARVARLAAVEDEQGCLSHFVGAIAVASQHVASTQSFEVLKCASNVPLDFVDLRTLW